jgi:hypothetical protein
MKKLLFFILILILSCQKSHAQRRILNIPDIKGYVTLKCDFHMHTVFSDGNVWPTYRIFEAYRDGLDAIAITDHLEYVPKKEFIPVDYNAAWKIAEASAIEGNIILVHATEITRSMPPGHLNALFIQDASLLKRDSVYDEIEAAVKQGAFIQWNHPGWKAQEKDGIPKLYELHKKLLKNGWINGIEFFNDSEYYPLVLDFCTQYKLAVVGNSDVHGIISESYTKPENTSRPMTLVFAKERTSASLKEALFAGRTIVWANDIIAGNEEYAKPFFYQCVSFGKPYYQNNRNSYFEVTNKSDITFYLINGSGGAPAEVKLIPNSVTRIVLGNKVVLPIVYDVKNVLTGEKNLLKVELNY